jgi:hypothetical protein
MGAIVPRVFLAIPTYDNTVHTMCMLGVLRASRDFAIQIACNGSSLLTHGFNILWAMANGSGADYFAMLHADIGPEPYWLDKLIGELEKHQADMLSAVVPIKSDERLFSTALAHPGQESHYRLNLDDLSKLPDTFGSQHLRDATGLTGNLCVNTGLWVCRLGQAWNRQVQFQMHTRIAWQDDGKAYCSVIPEDWDFSHQLHALGLNVMATRTVQLKHAGCMTWQTQHEPAG